jgi:hypothetical protein
MITSSTFSTHTMSTCSASPWLDLNWKQHQPWNHHKQILDDSWAHSRLMVTSTSNITTSNVPLESFTQHAGGTCSVVRKWSGQISKQGMDLHGLVWTYKGTHILLVGDFNKSLGKSLQGLNTIVSKHGILDLLPCHHGLDGEAETHSWGSKCLIDCAFGTQQLAELIVQIRLTPCDFIIA